MRRVSWVRVKAEEGEGREKGGWELQFPFDEELDVVVRHFGFGAFAAELLEGVAVAVLV